MLDYCQRLLESLGFDRTKAKKVVEEGVERLKREQNFGAGGELLFSVLMAGADADADAKRKEVMDELNRRLNNLSDVQVRIHPKKRLLCLVSPAGSCAPARRRRLDVDRKILGKETFTLLEDQKNLLLWHVTIRLPVCVFGTLACTQET